MPLTHPVGWRPWYSLRWKLPITISLIVTTILAVVLMGAYREMRSALIRASAHRASAAAGQVAGLLEGIVRPIVGQIRTTATEPALRAHLKTPSAETRAKAEGVLRTLLRGTGPRAATLWAVNGDAVAIATNGDPDSPVIQTTHPPSREGLELVRGGDAAFMQASAIVSDLAPSLDKLGYVTVRSSFAVTPAGLFSRLVGDDALVLLGTRDTDLWVDLGNQRIIDRRAPAHTDAYLGQVVEVRDTNLQIAVDFPEALVFAPMRQFLERMVALGLVIALGSAIAVRELTARFARPLADLTAATEAVAEGNFTTKIGSTRRDELGRLSRAFDAMTTRLADDIADRERVARALQNNEERMRYTLHAAQVGIFQVDLETGAMEYSDTMGPLLGRPVEDLPPKVDQTLSLIHRDDRATATASLTRSADDTGEHEAFVRAIHPDGSLRTLVTRSRQRIDASGRRLIAGVCIDVTEQKTLEEQLRQAQKMDAIGKLAGGIAHDFNNLLTAILGFGNMLLDSLEIGDSRRKEVEQILKAGRRAADLTAQLLAFSRKQLVQPVVVDVNHAVEESVVLLRRLLGENIHLETRLAAGGAMVRADPVQLQQVLMNLAINARDAMPDGGRLTIAISNVDQTAALADPRFALEPGPYVRLAVSDTGIGMIDAVRARLFEPFFTTKKRGEGTGLGLATVYGAVKQAGGYIQVESEVGRGSTFSIYLPQVQETQATPAPATKPVSAITGSETILLVEDEAAVRFLSRTMLERVGYRVVEAASAEAAETTHLAHAGMISLLITDVVLPGSSGAELFQRLSMRDPRLKVLYMSGYTDDAVFRTGRLQRGVAFLQKPFTADELRRKTREVLDE